MAATANPSDNNLSPRYSSGDNHGSPKSRRPPPRAAPSPWNQVVRGESESTSVVPSLPSSPSPSAAPEHQENIDPLDCSSPKDSCSSSSPECFPAENRAESSESTDGSSNAGKKPVWNKPSNGAVEVGPVMGAVSWPALSEAARFSAKPLSDSPKAPAEGSSTPTSQGTGVASSSSSQHKQVTNNANPNPISTPKNSYPARQRSFKRGGGSSTPNNAPPETPVIPGAMTETPQGNPSPRDHAHRGTNWESGQRGSQSNTGHYDHPQQRGSFRRGNGGPHPRGDGSYHHNYGSRRDHDRGNHDWNPHRNYNGRDAHMQQQRGVPRGFVRPPPPPPPFVPPPPVRPFSNPMGFEMAPPMVYIPPESFRGVPFVAPIPPHAMIFPSMDPLLHAKIVSQIEYYFSNENLIRDTYLRQNMDELGWVSIELIAGFNNVKKMTDNTQYILDALQTSTIVEVQGNKVRRRNDWMKWIMPSLQYTAVSGFESPLGSSSHDTLESRVQGVTLEERTNHNNLSCEVDARAVVQIGRSSSGNLYSQTHTSGPAEMDQGALQTASEISVFSRNSNERESC